MAQLSRTAGSDSGALEDVTRRRLLQADSGAGKDATRRRLLQAAADVIAERGYHAASLGDIAGRAGLTTGAVYSGFGSKKALLLAVVQETTQALVLDFDTLLEREGGLREVLEHLAVHAARTVEAPGTRQLVRLQVELLQLALRDPGVFQVMAEQARDQDRKFAHFLEAAARREGIDLPLPAEQLTTVFWATLQGLELARLADRASTPDSLFVSAVDLLLGWPPRPGAATPTPRSAVRTRSGRSSGAAGHQDP